MGKNNKITENNAWMWESETEKETQKQTEFQNVEGKYHASKFSKEHKPEQKQKTKVARGSEDVNYSYYILGKTT